MPFVSAMIAPPSPIKRCVPVVVGAPRDHSTGSSSDSGSNGSGGNGSSGSGGTSPSSAPEDTYIRPSVRRCVDPQEVGKRAAAFAAGTIRTAVGKDGYIEES